MGNALKNLIFIAFLEMERNSTTRYVNLSLDKIQERYKDKKIYVFIKIGRSRRHKVQQILTIRMLGGPING